MVSLRLLGVALVQVTGLSAHAPRELIENNPLRPVVVEESVRSERCDRRGALVCLLGVEPQAVGHLSSAGGVVRVPSSPAPRWVRGLAE
eukprot:2580561-Rhodomonas_salina.2